MRVLRHLFGENLARRRFPDAVLDAIQKAIAAGELRHAGQVCFAIEGGLPLRELVHQHSTRERAQAAFAHLRVWDTAQNSGVLIYVLLADHAIEIVADRGIAARVGAEEWQSICAQMQRRFAGGEFELGAVEGVTAVSDILARNYPCEDVTKANELPDRPVLL